MVKNNVELETLIKTRLADLNKITGHNYVPDKNTFRLSSATECPRKAYYQKVHTSKVPDNVHRIFLVGQVFHELVQDNVFSDEQCEIEVSDKYGDINLIGHCDILMDERVVELKTCSYIPKKPYPYHILQVNAYAKILGRDELDIVYLQKNKLDVKVYNLQTNDALYERLCENFHTAYEGIVSEGLPYKVKCSECRYCSYKELCGRDIR